MKNTRQCNAFPYNTSKLLPPFLVSVAVLFSIRFPYQNLHVCLAPLCSLYDRWNHINGCGWEIVTPGFYSRGFEFCPRDQLSWLKLSVIFNLSSQMLGQYLKIGLDCFIPFFPIHHSLLCSWKKKNITK